MKNNAKNIALGVCGLASLAFAIPLAVARAQDAPAVVPATPAPQVQTFPQQRNPSAPLPENSVAQDPRFNQVPPPGPGRFDYAPQAGMQMQMRGGMGGAPTMIGDENNLYVLMGNRLFKVSKNDLRVLKEGLLPVGQPGMQPGIGDGVPAGAPRQSGGGGGAK